MIDFQQKLQIGKHTLKNRAFLAPMAGITDAPFRAIATKYGAGLVVSEMIASAALSTGHIEMVRRLNKNADCVHSANMPHVVQLSGNEKKWLELGVKLAVDAGADIIDINFGCPSKRVVNGFAGAAIMKQPDKALRIVETVANTTELPISVKMRLGWDDDDINAVQIAKLAQSAGAQMIIVHARTRQQFYKGTARWELVKPVAKALSVPLIINGDIIDIKSADLALRQSGADGVMIGRGSYGRPWIVGQIGAALNKESQNKTPQGIELLQLIITHFEAMLSEYGNDIGIRVARKHIRYYLEVAGITREKALLKELLTNNDAANIINQLSQIFTKKSSRAA